MRLHLGCGTRYLDGYVNVDYPTEEHTVGASFVKPDISADITKISCTPESVEEIRSHHVFEHFQRSMALALICRWRDWLQPGGLLRIETPDVEASFRIMNSLFFSFDAKQQVMRHIFGSHEAAWGVHADGWYKAKFQVTLKALGFENILFKRNKWGVLRNIEVFAYRTAETFDAARYAAAVERLLTQSTVRVKQPGPVGSELHMLEVWLRMWREIYEAPCTLLN